LLPRIQAITIAAAPVESNYRQRRCVDTTTRTAGFEAIATDWWRGIPTLQGSSQTAYSSAESINHASAQVCVPCLRMIFNPPMKIRVVIAAAAAVTVGAAVTGVLAQTNSVAKPAAKPKPAVSITHDLSEVRSGNYQLDHDHARVIWNVSHHGYSTFSAVFSDIQGNLKLDAADPTRSQLTATVNMNSVGTLLPDFDARLKTDQFFNTTKFPTATFKSTRIERTSANALRVNGDLTFLGVTRPAVLEATFNQAGDGLGPPGYRVGFDGRMVINRSEYGMERSSIGDAVALQIEAEFESVGPKPAG